ncbi:MAG: Serine/threonine protein kinase [Labilithrix sp.]|nr:Serine/threonine protein kinase [Labilithrix sp.]
MTPGFRWCPHCAQPHALSLRFCAATGRALDDAIHDTKAARASRSKLAVFDTSPFVGTLLDGKYRITRAIGSGGMGVVYEAEAIALGTTVAVKVVRPHASSPEVVARLAREAKLAGAVRHPNICSVIDDGVLASGDPYLVLEHLRGQALAAWMRRVAHPPVRAVVDIFLQVLAGLAAAHDARIIHRDLKPENIFLVDRGSSQDPAVKLLDFGLARDLGAHRSDPTTRPGVACGTLQYMAPEQLEGNATGPCSDVFSVGVMLYEAICGRHPFAASSRLELQVNILRAKPRPLSQRRRGCPPELEAIIAQAMSKDPNDRQPDARTMAAQLAAVRLPIETVTSDLDDGPTSSTLSGAMWVPEGSSPAS